MVTPTIVEREPVTIVGLQTHFDGDDTVFEELWNEFGERWEEFDALTDDEAGYGVVTNFDEETFQFDYTVGVPLAEDVEVPDEFVVIDLLSGTYATFESTLDSFEDDYNDIQRDWLPESAYERRPGPEFEVYDETFTPDDPDSTYAYFFPVSET